VSDWRPCRLNDCGQRDGGGCEQDGSGSDLHFASVRIFCGVLVSRLSDILGGSFYCLFFPELLFINTSHLVKDKEVVPQRRCGTNKGWWHVMRISSSFCWTVSARANNWTKNS
jgi:hypothetical protein